MFQPLLPPGSTALERRFDQVSAFLLDLPVDIRDLWSPWDCPLSHLPWLAWGLSVDIWDANWPEWVKRAAVADAITFHQHKGTAASLRTVLDRFDPLIRIVEWFDDRATLDPFTFRLELPLGDESNVVYDEALIAQILRDIAMVKPVRSHMLAVQRLSVSAQAWLVSAASIGGYQRLDAAADRTTALDPFWLNFLLTEQGEPILGTADAFLEII